MEAKVVKYIIFTFSHINFFEKLRFDEAIRLCLEAGLVEEWKYRTWVRMKEESRKKLGKIELKEEVENIAFSIKITSVLNYF